MDIPEDLSQGLLVKFGEWSCLLPPPSARVAMRVRAMMGELEKAEHATDKLRDALEAWEEELEQDPESTTPRPVAEYTLDLEKLGSKLGVDISDSNMNKDLLGEELYDLLLDELDINQFDLVTQAMYIWSTAGKDAAERFLQDPTGRPNRASRRRKRKGTSR